MRVASIITVTTALVAGLSVAAAAPAGAHTPKPAPKPSVTVLSTAVEMPYNLEVRRGKLLVADSRVDGLIGKVIADGTVTTLIAPAKGVSGLALSRNGKYLAYTYLIGAGPPAQTIASGVIINGPGSITATADVFAYEKANNPDHGVTYGIPNAGQCVIEELMKVSIPAYYNGLDESYPASVATYGRDFVVADTRANTLLRVTRSGVISTLAVLPPQPLTFTADIAARLGLASCVVGLTYNFEAAPTDVEVGGDGYLYVTTRAGGPAGLDLGARGKVYRVNPRTGVAKELADGLSGPTNLALSGGRIFVAELDAGRISVVQRGNVREYVALPGALAIEAGKHGLLYAATLFTGPGSVVRIDTRKGGRH